MKKLLNKLLLGAVVVAPTFVFAASPFLKPIKDLLGDLEIFISFLNWALPALGILIFFILIIAFVASKAGIAIPGITFDKDKGGRNVMWAIFGLAAMFAVYGLIQLIGALFGVDTNRAKTITAPSLPQVGGFVEVGTIINNYLKVWRAARDHVFWVARRFSFPFF